MSRIGKKPVAIPAGVEVKIDGSVVTVKGPKGTLTKEFNHIMKISQEGNEIIVERPDDENFSKSVHGLTRTLIHNMVEGVTNGFSKELKINGVGYRCQKSGKKDIIKIEGDVSGLSFDILGYVDPKISITFIENGHVAKKSRPEQPKRLVNVIKCKNPRCITSIEEGCDHIFALTPSGKYRCVYCEQEFSVKP